MIVSSHSTYDHDQGTILVAGHAHPPASSGQHMDGEGHFDYFALEGRTGALRWQHTARDFHRELHGDEKLTPQMDYRLDLEAVGAVAGGIDGRHEGERPWRLFRESVLAELPHTWRHPHDSRLSLARFDRTRRPEAADNRRRAAASATAVAAGANAIAAASASHLLRSRESVVGSGDAHNQPNVLVAHRRCGLEVLHLYTGRTLTQLALTSSLHAQPSSHADLNGDGAIDHVVALSQHQAQRAAQAQASLRRGQV